MQITPSDKILFLYDFNYSARSESCCAESNHRFCVFNRLDAACGFDLYVLADVLCKEGDVLSCCAACRKAGACLDEVGARFCNYLAHFDLLIV